VLRGVLFDLFGTLVAPFSRARHSTELSVAARHLGLDPIECEKAWRADYRNRVRGNSGGIAGQMKLIAEARRTELPTTHLKLIVHSYERFCDKAMTPAPGALDTLQALAKLSIPVGLVSNISPDMAAAFERTTLRPFFRTCTYSCEVGVAKPEPEIYSLAAETLGFDPGDLLFVGDGSDDELGGAARAGLTPALIKIETADIYDPERVTWRGLSIDRLKDVVGLIGRSNPPVL